MDYVDCCIFDSLIYLCHSTWLQRKSYQLFVQSSSALKSTNLKLSSLHRTSKSVLKSWRSLRLRKRRQQQPPPPQQPRQTNVHASIMEVQCLQPRLGARAMLMSLLSHQPPHLSGHHHTPSTLLECQPIQHHQPCMRTEAEAPHTCTHPKLLLTQAPPTHHMEATAMAWHQLTIKLTTDRRRHNYSREIW